MSTSVSTTSATGSTGAPNGSPNGSPNGNSGGTKFCVKCHADVTNAKRRKDPQGLYWCETCAHADSEAKHSSKMKCSLCRQSYGPDKMTMMDGKPVCEGCMTVGTKSAAGEEGMSERTKKAIKLTLALLMIAGGALSYFMFM